MRPLPSFVGVILFVHHAAMALPEVQLATSEPFVALADDLDVLIFKTDVGSVVFLRHENDEQPLAAQIVTQSTQKDGAALVFDCGYFWRLGVYHVFIANASDPLGANLATANITVKKFAKIELKLKKFHEAQTTDVQAIVVTPEKVCRSTVVSQYTTQLVMTNHNTSDETYQQSTFPPGFAIFSCSTFALPGRYTVSMVLRHGGDHVVVSESDVMEVVWSNEYDLDFHYELNYCYGKNFAVGIRRPACIREQDVVLAVVPRNNQSDFVIAKRRIGRKERVVFPCRSTLMRANATGVCFHYLSSGVVTKTACRPMMGSSVSEFNVNGNWGLWSGWSMCQRPCPHSIWKRSRSCDNPEPWGSGIECGGNGSSSDRTGLQTQRQFRLNFVEEASCSNPPQNSSSSALCRCGCLVHATDAEQSFASPLLGQCGSQREITWNVFTSPDHVIRFRVIDLQTFYGEAVTISESQLGTATITFPNQTVTTGSNLATVKYIMMSMQGSIESCGFVISYRGLAKNSVATKSTVPQVSTTLTPEADESWTDSITKNPVVVIAIAGCAVVIVVLCIVIACYRWKQRSDRRTRNADSSAKCRLTTPPDGKSCSNIDTESDRPQPLGETTQTDLELQQSQKPRAAYYLAQRQLQLMKKQGHERSSQLYMNSCLNSQQIQEQQDLLFGPLENRGEPGS